MKVMFIDLKKKTPKMSPSMKEFVLFEGTDVRLYQSQNLFVSLESLTKILTDLEDQGQIKNETSHKIIDGIESLIEQR